MIQGILNYIYTGAAGLLIGAAAATYLTSTFYGSKIDAIEARYDRDVAEKVAQESRTAVRWVEVQREAIAKLEKALSAQAKESQRKVNELQKTTADFRGKLDRGWVFVDPKAKPPTPAGSKDAGNPGAPGPSGGNTAGVISGQTSADLFAFASDAELTRISLFDQRQYALQCYAAYSEMRVKYNALISGQDKP